jgi:HK97 family phage major capsid protein
MIKKKVTLDVFEESVLPMLQQKHKPKNGDISALQKAITDEYFIYEEGDEGVKTQVKYSVSTPPKAAGEEGDGAEPQDLKSMIAEGVTEALKAMGHKPGNPLGNGGGTSGGEKKFTVPAECKRYGQLKAFTQKSVAGSEFTADERAYRFGMWGLAARGNETAKAWCDEHGIGLQEKKFSDELLQKLHSEGTNTAGGYLVPEEFGQDIIILREQYGVARRLCNMVPMSSDTRTDPRQIGGLTASFVGEDQAGTESTANWDQVRLTVKDLMVLSRMTNQVNADAIINFGDKLAYECGYATALKEDQCLFLGDASSTYGGITGVRQALANKWTAATAGTINGITKASSTTLASLALADFENAVGSLPQFADTDNAVWVCHRYFYQAVMVKLLLASGGVVGAEVANGSRRPRPLFLGYPVEFSQVLPSTTAATTLFALLGDFTLGASFGDRQQNMVSFSEHATVGGVSVFERNEVAIRSVERFDINVHDVGDGTTPGPIVAVATG